MQAALACLAARHEALRTRFVERDGQVLQAVLPASDPHAKLALQRLSLPDGGAPGELERLLAELTERPHQLLGAGVPARFVLVQLGPDSHILHINMHHISRSAPRPWSPSVPASVACAHVVLACITASLSCTAGSQRRLIAPRSAEPEHAVVVAKCGAKHGPCVPPVMAGAWAC